jgi:hypothetical protein
MILTSSLYWEGGHPAIPAAELTLSNFPWLSLLLLANHKWGHFLILKPGNKSGNAASIDISFNLISYGDVQCPKQSESA